MNVLKGSDASKTSIMNFLEICNQLNLLLNERRKKDEKKSLSVNLCVRCIFAKGERVCLAT
jgi:hypothetical protein